jgi:exonuclease VII large subunit
LIASKNREKVQSLQHRLENGSLQATLQRGYVMIKNSDGIIIDRASMAEKEPQLKALFQDGEIALKNDK